HLPVSPSSIYPSLTHSLIYLLLVLSFFFIHTPTPAIYTLSLHDALPISRHRLRLDAVHRHVLRPHPARRPAKPRLRVRHPAADQDRKSTRLNSSHVKISYAVFCLKKKKKKKPTIKKRRRKKLST